MAYIYVRHHQAYDGAKKIGKTMSIPDRDSQYATGELRRGIFEAVFLVRADCVDKIEKMIQREFAHLNIYYDSGTEFFDAAVVDMIEPYFVSEGIEYKKLTTQEIDDLVRVNRKTNIVLPRTDQQEIIDSTVAHFRANDRGMLVLTCGVGKTLISLWIAKALGAKSIVVGVPNLLLLEQWANEIKKIFATYCVFKIFQGTTKKCIEHTIASEKNIVVVATYSSAHKLEKIKNKFDVKILDEAHHLTAKSVDDNEDKKTFVRALFIDSKKQLSLTATLKDLDHEGSISNSCVAYFGEVIERRCLLWAIREQIVCDYVVQVVAERASDEQHYTSAMATLKSVSDNNAHHLLVYTNSQDSASNLAKTINRLSTEKLFCSDFNGCMRKNAQDKILTKFKDSKIGIIVCVYCLGEGFDLPLIDGVVFAENMTSRIRIVQSALRACRKDRMRPNKMAKIILPIVWSLEVDDAYLRNVREVIQQMGIEDETICQKVKVYDMAKKDGLACVRFSESYDDEMTNNLMLRTIKRVEIGITYEKAKKIVSEYGARRSKEEYAQLCDKDIRLPKNPDEIFGDKFVGWIDYLGIERTYYEFDECQKVISNILRKNCAIKNMYPDLARMCIALCEIDAKFPPAGLWPEYYDMKSMTEIIKVETIKKRQTMI
jgi:superfamily II DNA or RNA helicase